MDAMAHGDQLESAQACSAWPVAELQVLSTISHTGSGVEVATRFVTVHCVLAARANKEYVSARLHVFSRLG